MVDISSCILKKKENSDILRLEWVRINYEMGENDHSIEIPLNQEKRRCIKCSNVLPLMIQDIVKKYSSSNQPFNLDKKVSLIMDGFQFVFTFDDSEYVCKIEGECRLEYKIHELEMNLDKFSLYNKIYNLSIETLLFDIQKMESSFDVESKNFSLPKLEKMSIHIYHSKYHYFGKLIDYCKDLKLFMPEDLLSYEKQMEQFLEILHGDRIDSYYKVGQ
jgi:hypothetical protein